MKKAFIVLLLLLVPFFVFAIEEHLSINYSPVFSSIKMTVEGTTTTSTVTTSLLELSAATYWGHSGIAYKFRIGRVVKSNGEKVDNSDLGFNQAFGYSYITDINENLDLVAEILLLYIHNKTTGYVSYEYYSIDFYLLDLHGAVQLKYYISPVTTLNLGVDLGTPVYGKVKGGGVYEGKTLSPKMSGIRFSPFIGIGVKL